MEHLIGKGSPTSLPAGRGVSDPGRENVPAEAGRVDRWSQPKNLLEQLHIIRLRECEEDKAIHGREEQNFPGKRSGN